MTVYTYRTTITVRVRMSDNGAVDPDDGEVVSWLSPAEQEASARDWAEQAMPLETFGEEWVEVDAPPLQLVGSAQEHGAPKWFRGGVDRDLGGPETCRASVPADCCGDDCSWVHRRDCGHPLPCSQHPEQRAQAQEARRG